MSAVAAMLRDVLAEAGALCQCHHLAVTHDAYGLCIMDRTVCGCTGLRLYKLKSPADDLPWRGDPNVRGGDDLDP